MVMIMVMMAVVVMVEVVVMMVVTVVIMTKVLMVMAADSWKLYWGLCCTKYLMFINSLNIQYKPTR